MSLNWNTPISELEHNDAEGSAFWDMNIDELTHGDIKICYVDLDPDEIVHFLYIKKEKLPNGKYRYYYDQSELDNAKADHAVAELNLRDAKSASEAAEAELASAKEHLDMVTNATPTSFAEKLAIEGGKIVANTKISLAETKINKLKPALVEAGKKYADTKAKVTKLSAGHSIKKAISKGIIAVANFFSNLLPAPKKK